jgi:hypothetical protein
VSILDTLRDENMPSCEESQGHYWASLSAHPMVLGLANNNLVKSLRFPQAPTRLLLGSRAREQARKDYWTWTRDRSFAA